MLWWTHIPMVSWCVWVFVVGLGVGSFLNVAIARLPYQKSLIWPGSRCFTCLQPIRLLDNLPIIGYLRLRGQCRNCGATFSSRYLWVELGTGVAFLTLFVVEIVLQSTNGPDFLKPWQHSPGLQFSYFRPAPPLHAWAYWAYHASLLALLIAAALIDLEHKIIPPQITYIGTLIGLIGSTLMPWPWPTDPATIPLARLNWLLPNGLIPVGAAIWPFAGPPPGWAPSGSWQLGLLTGIIGAAAGMFVGRAIKFLFEVGFRKEALGLGDADLLMMAGAFLGWQVAVLAMPVGALVTLPIVLALKTWSWIRKKDSGSELPFGPGLVAGVVVVWFSWPWMGELVAILFDTWIVLITAAIMGGGMLIAGLLLRRGEPAGAQANVST